MTGLLKETFTEQAEAAEERGLDVEAVLRSGERRLRQRKLKRTFVAAAATIAVAAGGLTAQQTLRSGEQVATSTGPVFTEHRATYATGDKIHFGDDVLDLGKVRATSFVQTDVGFVLTDQAGAVYLADGHAVRAIGNGNRQQQLTVDAGGTLVGWVDGNPGTTGPTVPAFVVYDVAAGREVARTGVGNRPGAPRDYSGPRVSAIDGGVAYFGSSEGLYRWDLGTGKGELIKRGVASNFLYGARNGVLFWQKKPGGHYFSAAPRLDDPAAKTFTGWSISLSPSGRFMFTDTADEVRLYDVSSGQQLPMEFPGYALIAPTQWIADEAVYAIGYKPAEKEPADLLRCSVQGGSCTVVKPAVMPDPTKPSIQLPVGQPFD